MIMNILLLGNQRWVAKEDGSNFIKYIDYFLDLMHKHKNMELLFIEHPLLRDELHKMIGKKKAAAIFDKLNDLPNIKTIAYDDFLDDIFNADLFIGDYCSTIIEFALTGRPIIYCSTNVEFNPFGQKLIQGMYAANTAEEIDKYIKDLRQGTDPLKKTRKENIGIISESLGNHKSIAQKLLKYLEKNLKKISLKNKIRYKIWKHLDKKLRKEGIIP